MTGQCGTSNVAVMHRQTTRLTRLAVRSTALAALAAGAVSAQASTVEFNEWTFGSGNTVHTSSPVYNGLAGGFSGTLDGESLLTYCVELTQVFYWNTPYTNYTDMAASSYFTGADDKAGKLGRLLSYVADNAGAVDTAAEATSPQLAVSNIVDDIDGSRDGGAFTDSSGRASYASSLLAASQNWSNTMDVRVLKSPGAQDQLHWGRVPEPASLGLALIALGIAGAASRRRG
mgnify:CR=1 FL=1